MKLSSRGGWIVAAVPVRSACVGRVTFDAAQFSADFVPFLFVKSGQVVSQAGRVGLTFAPAIGSTMMGRHPLG